MASAVASEPSPNLSADSMYQDIEAYPWAADSEFQSGLIAILGPNPLVDQAQKEDLTLRARCFYYSRKFETAVDFVSYKSWRTSQPVSSLSPLESVVPAQDCSQFSSQDPHSDIRRGDMSNGTSTSTYTDRDSIPSTQQAEYEPRLEPGSTITQPEPGYPASFDEVVRLIQTGQPIPGIKDIPDTVLLGHGTQPTRQKRQKPWERSVENTAYAGARELN